MPKKISLKISLKSKLSTLKKKISSNLRFIFFFLAAILVITGFILENINLKKSIHNLRAELNLLVSDNAKLNQNLASASATITKLLSEDQRLRNDKLEATVSAIQKTYASSLKSYEEILDLHGDKADTQNLEDNLSQIFSYLSQSNYASASTTLNLLNNDISLTRQKLIQAAALAIPEAPVSNTAPTNGYSRQKVQTEIGEFTVSLVAGDLSTTKVIIDTASDSTCTNDCPVLSLSDYVSRNGAYAGINGTYFCPTSYPSCAGKTNSFDLLVMNKNKTYFNSDNNVYSTNPVVIFGSGYVKFIGAASGWGRDTGIDGMLSNFPLLLSSGQTQFAGDSDPKKISRNNRSFVANKGNTAYIGVVHGASVAESAITLKALGLENALNLDSGGSTALWSGGYKVGPGRNIPNAILFIQK